MAKHTKKDFAPQVEQGKMRHCDAPGCKEMGAYRAPRSKSDLQHYYYFCLEHVREHNKQWDYFSGMNADEIEAFMKDAVTGHRPTWERMGHIPNPQERLYAAVHEFMSGRRKTKPIPQVNAKVRKALALFELDYPYTAADLKKRYKELVKRTHPDHHKGDKMAEEKFKAITVAHKTLEAHLKQ